MITSKTSSLRSARGNARSTLVREQLVDELERRREEDRMPALHEVVSKGAAACVLPVTGRPKQGTLPARSRSALDRSSRRRGVTLVGRRFSSSLSKGFPVGGL